MFEKSAPKVQASPELEISTIPSEFYGGANPAIKFRETGKNLVEPPKHEVDAPVVKNTRVSTGFFASQTFLMIGAAVLFLVFAGGAGLYYWMIGKQAQKPVVPAPQPPVVITTTSTEDYSTTTTSDVTSTIPVINPSSTALAGGIIEFPSTLLGNTNDLDHDGLTDAEEEVFHTDPAVPDSDSDGYDDGTEIYNIYSPTDYAPTRLITTANVKDYTNPAFNYRLYYPADWAVANVDQGYKDVLFSTITGENIEVRVFDRDPGQSFEDWFGTWAPGQSLGALSNFSTVFKETGIARNDNLVFYFTDEAHVYVIAYHVTGSDNKINYRAIIAMMARSFRAPGSDKAITDLKVYTKPIGATSTPTEQVDYPKNR